MTTGWVNAPKPAALRFWMVTAFAVLSLGLAVPVAMVLLSGAALPWDRLADIGDAFGGASALLSALALSGVGASLLFQQRQIRQELADLDRQQHLELLKLAIENPELIEVLDAETARGDHARQEIYANLTMMYWLAIWELGEIDDEELRGMAASMFRSGITRQWWARVGDAWIGTREHPERHRFIDIVTGEFRAAGRVATGTGAPAAKARPFPGGAAVAVSGLVVLGGLLVFGRAYARRSRSARTSSTKERHAPEP
ncbi:DUF6082 family protein [Actinoplanes sp. NPDC051851]|uniref:DUF6082 family protein n=1 Tax=Actinoplanes sp. NPDC051851 TaxID=3154753 RepID=UPI003441464B